MVNSVSIFAVSQLTSIFYFLLCLYGHSNLKKVSMVSPRKLKLSTTSIALLFIRILGITLSFFEAYGIT